MDQNSQATQSVGAPGTQSALNQVSPQVVLWSRYKRIQELITQPILPLVVLIGPLQCTTWVQRIIREQMKMIRQQTAQASSLQDLQETSKHNLRIKCYEFYHTYRSSSNPDGQLEMPPFYKEQQYGFNSGMFKKQNVHEIGHIKLRFFDSITVYKPAVTVMIFDWQTQQASSFDWGRCENKILEEVKNFQEKCAVTAKDTRIILLIMLPLSGEIPIDKCRTSLKNALQQSQQGEDGQGVGVKQVLMMPKGIEGLRSNPKEFIKKVIEQCGQFYAVKKRDIKAKQRKLVNKDQTEHVRYFFKVGIYSQLSKGDLLASMKHIKQAYDDMRTSSTSSGILSKQQLDERRENADIIMIQLLFEEIIAKASSTNGYTYYLAKLEEQKWRANWHVTIAKMLESKPVLFNDNQNIYQMVNKQANSKGRQGNNMNQSPWLTDTQLESLFSGYHHFNCMLALLRRRQEIKRMIESFRELDSLDTRDIYTKLKEDVQETVLVDKSKMLGREYTLGKNTNPLMDQSPPEGMQGGMYQTQIILERQKLLMFIEGLDDLNLQILRSGQIALSSYKAKNQLMAQYDVENTTNNYKFMKAQCHRMIQFIHFHLATHIFDLKEDQDKITRNETDLAKICKQTNFIVDEHLLKEGQKYRDAVATQMMADGWQSEAIAFLEDYRSFQETLSIEQGRPEDIFQYEMQILNYSKTLTRDQRCERFLKLVNSDFSSLTAERGPIVSTLNGANLIWARARFDREMGQDVQVNQWVKLTIEVFSRLKGDGVDVATLKACFNDDGFDFESPGGILSREKPILIEQEIYLDEAKVYKHLRSKDKLLSLILENVVIKLRDKPILFCLQPYLTAKDKIEPKLERKGAGLKLPVALPIKDMPPMLEFKFQSTSTIQETLIGNKHRFKVVISRAKNVNLKSLKLQFEQITYSGGDIRADGDDHIGGAGGVDRVNEFRDPYLQQRRTAIQGMPSRRTEMTSNTQQTSVMQVSRKPGKGKKTAIAVPKVNSNILGEASEATFSGLSDEQLLNAPKENDNSLLKSGDSKQGSNDHPLDNNGFDDRDTMAMFDPTGEQLGKLGGEEEASKEFEIGYQYDKADSGSSFVGQKELDYPNETVVEFPKEIIAKIKEADSVTSGKPHVNVENDDSELSIYFTFFEPSMNYASLKFTYTFTQTYEDAADLLGLKQAKESVEFTQDYSHVLKIKSIQPFEILWGLVRSSDPFLRINDPMPNMPGQQPYPLQQEMKTALDQNFKVWCKIRNVSTSMPLQITKTALQLALGEAGQMNEKQGKFQPTRIIGLLAQEKAPLVCFSENKSNYIIQPREQMQLMSESIMISDQEIEYIFNNQESGATGMADQGFKGNMISGFDNPGGRSAAPTGGTVLNIDDFLKIKKQRATYHTSYIIQNPFKLDLNWCEANQKQDEDEKFIDKLEKDSSIESSVTAPQSLNLIKVPIKVEIRGEIVSKSGDQGNTVPVTTLKLEKPVQVIYKISNLCDNHIFECVALLDVQSKHFYASGDVRTRFEIMPLDYVELEFQLLPLQLGLHNLPKLHIIDKTVNHEAMQLQGKMLNDVEFLNQLKDKNQPIGYLIKGFTRRVLIQN